MTKYQITKHTAGVVADKISALAADWLEFNSDKAACTVKTYNQAIKNFLAWLADNGVDNPDRKTVINYRDSLCDEKSIATARLYLSAVKIFSKWLAVNGQKDFASGVTLPRLDEEGETHKREALTLTEAKSVLNSMKGATEKQIRDKLIMQVMMNCGLRTVEVVRLDTTDLERRGGKIFLRVQGKGRKSKARVELPKKLYQQLVDYLQNRKARFHKGEPMFTSTANRNRGQRLQTQSISRLAKATFNRCGINSSSITAHSCRHFFATELLKSGVELRRVSKLLRHKDLKVTEIYLHDAEELTDNSIEKLAALIVA